MSFVIPAYTKKTAEEALNWLKGQEKEWSDCIQNMDVVVQLYRNCKNRSSKEKEFSRELKELAGKTSSSLTVARKDKRLSEPLLQGSRNPAPPFSAGGDPRAVDSSTSLSKVSLNGRSRELAAKVARRLDLKGEEAALNLLVQVGFASLKNLLKDI